MNIRRTLKPQSLGEKKERRGVEGYLFWLSHLFHTFFTLPLPGRCNHPALYIVPLGLSGLTDEVTSIKHGIQGGEHSDNAIDRPWSL